MDALISRLQERIQVAPATDCQQVPAIVPATPLTLDEVRDFEYDTGITLPPLIVRLYTEVANGGFGPSWGINRLRGDDDNSVEAWDHVARQQWKGGRPPQSWPEPFIRFCEEGCGIYYGVDCSTADGPVYIVDPSLGGGHSRKSLSLLARSVEAWLTDWVTKPPPALNTPR